jgi:phosphopantothenoylcysteine decarboxylase / phosphopantothenate---cysteine ligase
MYDAVMRELTRATVFIGAAAVADYKPSQESRQKIKKSEASISLKLVRTRDILKEVAAQRSASQLAIGFAAETENVIENARQKMVEKKLDAIIANDVTRGDAGFDSADNVVTIISGDQTARELPLMSKQEVAHRILDEVLRLRNLGTSQAAVGLNSAHV